MLQTMASVSLGDWFVYPIGLPVMDLTAASALSNGAASYPYRPSKRRCASRPRESRRQSRRCSLGQLEGAGNVPILWNAYRCGHLIARGIIVESGIDVLDRRLGLDFLLQAKGAFSSSPLRSRINSLSDTSHPSRKCLRNSCSIQLESFSPSRIHPRTPSPPKVTTIASALQCRLNAPVNCQP